MKDSSGEVYASKDIIRVLLITDNPDDILNCAAMLGAATDATFDISHADRIKRGMTLVREGADIVILASSVLKGKSAKALTGLQNGTPHVPVILLTSENEKKSRDMARRYGARDYLSRESLNTELLSRTLRYAVEVEHLRDNLTELEHMKDGFASGISHELRIPLHSIHGFTQLLLEGMDDDRDTRQEFLNIIKQQSERLGNTIDILLDTSIIAPGQFDVETAPVSFQGIVGEAIDYIKPIANEKDITIASDAGADDITVRADRTRIKQVIAQLLHNAIKFSDNGSTVNLAVKVIKNEVVLTVTDRGIGIPEECLPYIFERFYQAKNRQHTEGVGMGLYFARQVILAHNGKIQVTSRPEEGSSFTLKLPVITGNREAISS